MYNPDEGRYGKRQNSLCCNRNLVERVNDTEFNIPQGGGCGANADSTWGLRGYPLASVYSPLQDFTEIYDCENALVRGTVFAQLDLPFVCGGINGGVLRG